MASGLVMIGIFSIIIVFAVPEAIRLTNLYFPYDQEYNVNFCSGWFTSFMGMGQVAGPLFGSYLTSKLGFRHENDIIALIFAFFVAVYMTWGCGFKTFKMILIKKEQREEDAQIEFDLSMESPKSLTALDFETQKQTAAIKSSNPNKLL